jgi:uncharacterized protein (DUF4415 family)
MSTIKDDNFDYQNYVKKNSPVTTEVKRGTNARRQRLETAIKRFTIRIDEDILEQFQQLVPQGQGYERLINQALREWLSARGIKELVREELQDIVHKTSFIRRSRQLPWKRSYKKSQRNREVL